MQYNVVTRLEKFCRTCAKIVNGESSSEIVVVVCVSMTRGVEKLCFKRYWDIQLHMSKSVITQLIYLHEFIIKGCLSLTYIFL